MITISNFPRGARGIRMFWLCEEMGLAYRARLGTRPAYQRAARAQPA
ncbi:MAG: hypothetical protein ACREHE_09575 [Rhizomicrobium sp.]